MSSVSRALELLSLFTETRPEIGLSQLCRIAGRDKATTYRHLQALESAFFVEQNPLTKAYRLGPAVLNLANLREATVPRKEAAQSALAVLADETGETAHVSVLSGDTMYSLASCESQRHSTRAIIDITTLPLHATASGIAAIAFGPKRLLDVALSDMPSLTAHTPTTEAALRDEVGDARATGFAQSARTFEADLISVSTPIYDQSGEFAGAVSVASVATRFNAELDIQIKTALVQSSRHITQSWGGTLPPNLTSAWADTLSAAEALESAT